MGRYPQTAFIDCIAQKVECKTFFNLNFQGSSPWVQQEFRKLQSYFGGRTQITLKSMGAASIKFPFSGPIGKGVGGRYCHWEKVPKKNIWSEALTFIKERSLKRKKICWQIDMAGQELESLRSMSWNIRGLNLGEPFYSSMSKPILHIFSCKKPI